ncbi:hypothetical protein [Streptomyces sp. NPDC001348]
MTAPYAARDDDTEGLVQIAELLEKVADEKAPLPDIEATRRRPSHGLHLTSRLTVGEWLDMWPAGKKGRQSAISRDGSNIRVHLKPRIGHLRLDRLRVTHSCCTAAVPDDLIPATCRTSS